jgi:hypothetical protein
MATTMRTGKDFRSGKRKESPKSVVIQDAASPSTSKVTAWPGRTPLSCTVRSKTAPLARLLASMVEGVMPIATAGDERKRERKSAKSAKAQGGVRDRVMRSPDPDVRSLPCCFRRLVCIITRSPGKWKGMEKRKKERAIVAWRP